MTTIRIIKCSDNHFWYKELIGKTFSVEYEEYYSSGNKAYAVIFLEDTRMIHASDAEIISDDMPASIREITDSLATFLFARESSSPIVQKEAKRKSRQILYDQAKTLLKYRKHKLERFKLRLIEIEKQVAEAELEMYKRHAELTHDNNQSIN